MEHRIGVTVNCAWTSLIVAGLVVASCGGGGHDSGGDQNDSSDSTGSADTASSAATDTTDTTDTSGGSTASNEWVESTDPRADDLAGPGAAVAVT